MIVFLDRDGVINRFPGKGRYVTTLSGFRFLPGARRAISLLTKAGCRIHVISNQGCVSRGLITRETLAAITDRMLKNIRSSGGRIRSVHYCPHQTSDACGCKKPKTKLLTMAVGGRRIDVKRSVFVGDSAEDMKAGADFGCRTILVLSGRTRRRDIASLGIVPDEVHADLLSAAKSILRNDR